MSKNVTNKAKNLTSKDCQRYPDEFAPAIVIGISYGYIRIYSMGLWVWPNYDRREVGKPK